MKVIHDEALAGDPFHLREHVDQRRAMKVMEEKGRVGEVNGPVLVGEGTSVADLDADLRAKSGGEPPVEIRPGVPDRDRVRVDSDQIERTSEAVSAADQVGQVVPAAAPQVQQAEAVTMLQNRVQEMVRGPVSPEHAVEASKVAEGADEAAIGDREVVHPLVGLQARGQIREGRRTH
jgi:hypothetical protein